MTNLHERAAAGGPEPIPCRRRFVAWCLAAALSLAAGSTLAAAAEPAPPGPACATAHPRATQACMEILAAGGNAFDAAVAASAVLAVVAPDRAGLGGGGFWLLHRADDETDVFVDGREFAPGTIPAATAGPVSAATARAAIPGLPAALDLLARRYGSRPLATTLAPAVTLARDGFAIDAALAATIAAAAPRLSWAARRVLMPDGRAPAAGALLRQRDLAATLEQFAAQGRGGFYEGEVGGRLLKAVQATGGGWHADDLRRYRAAVREPLQFNFRGYRITTAPPPSRGGLVLAQSFQQLEIVGWRDDGAPQSVRQWRDALRRSQTDVAGELGDPDWVHVPTPELLARDHARALSAAVDVPRAARDAAAAPGRDAVAADTAFAVVDAQGNRVAATLSMAAPFGSAFMVPGTGVLLNAAMAAFAPQPGAANAIAPYKRPLAPGAPSFVEGPRGLWLGAAADDVEAPTCLAAGVARWIREDDAAATVAGCAQRLSWIGWQTADGTLLSGDDGRGAPRVPAP